MLLQSPEGFGKLSERGTIAKSTWLALNDRQIMPQIINRLTRAVMRAADYTGVFADNKALSGDDNTVRIELMRWMPLRSASI